MNAREKLYETIQQYIKEKSLATDRTLEIVKKYQIQAKSGLLDVKFPIEILNIIISESEAQE